MQGSLCSTFLLGRSQAHETCMFANAECSAADLLSQCCPAAGNASLFRGLQASWHRVSSPLCLAWPKSQVATFLRQAAGALYPKNRPENCQRVRTCRVSTCSVFCCVELSLKLFLRRFGKQTCRPRTLSLSCCQRCSWASLQCLPWTRRASY